MDEARQRQAICEDKLHQMQMLEQQLLRARIEAQHEQEAFTFWLALTHGIHPERGEHWNLDLGRMTLTLVVSDAPPAPGTAPDAPASQPASAPPEDALPGEEAV